jgi:hypothetical protein
VQGALPGAVHVQDSPALEFLHGLEDITAIGSLRLSGNSLLASIAALGSVQGALPGSVKVQNCPALESLRCLENITTIGRDSNGFSLLQNDNSQWHPSPRLAP